jgi:hypothetical protein
MALLIILCSLLEEKFQRKSKGMQCTPYIRGVYATTKNSVF